MSARLIIIALILIALSLFMSSPSSPIFSGQILPVAVEELMQMNPD